MAKGRLQQAAHFADNFEQEKKEELFEKKPGPATPRDIAALLLPDA
jgi:hypothetical protein